MTDMENPISPPAPKKIGRPRVDHTQTLKMLANGWAMDSICFEIGISAPALRMRLLNARKQYGARTTHHLIAKAVATGLVSIE